ncbi:Dabb family protein [Cohnella cholangitidis]|uniref:Dabb family protein n=1 Tax=Cohnella cholangitidis TaxID=2598458 RepID=A0A7G5BYS5_9BACL|nr:Dabb family protein [Cohnella cholangitidis]QMV42109.1 Dabb family protein [Cohnella cholangitidis]
MFEHIVLLKLNSNFSTDQQEDVVRSVLAFKDEIPGSIDISAGINITEEVEHKQGYTLGIRVTFENQQACRDYNQHSLHQNLLQSIGPFVEGIVVMDYPIA